MEVVLNILDTVAVVLPLQSPPVQHGVPVLVSSLLPSVAVVAGVTLVQGGHHPVPEVGPGSAGSGHLQGVEAHLGHGERGEDGEDQGLSHHDQAEAWSGLVSLLPPGRLYTQPGENRWENQQTLGGFQSEIQTTGTAFNVINIHQSHSTTGSNQQVKKSRLALPLVILNQNVIFAFWDVLDNSDRVWALK